MLYTAYGKECRLTFSFIFAGQWGLRSEYKNNSGDWIYIAEPTIFETNLTTTESTDEAYKKSLDKINIAMAEMFGGDTSEPESGTDRIKWLVDNKTIVENNNLKIG